MRAGQALRDKWAADARHAALRITPAEVAAMIAYDEHMQRVAHLYGALIRAARRAGRLTDEQAVELAFDAHDKIARRYPPAQDVVLARRSLRTAGQENR